MRRQSNKFECDKFVANNIVIKSHLPPGAVEVVKTRSLKKPRPYPFTAHI